MGEVAIPIQLQFAAFFVMFIVVRILYCAFFEPLNQPVARRETHVSHVTYRQNIDKSRVGPLTKSTGSSGLFNSKSYQCDWPSLPEPYLRNRTNTRLLKPLSCIFVGEDIEGIRLTKFLNQKYSTFIDNLSIIKYPVAREACEEKIIPFADANVYKIHCPSIFAAYLLRKKEYQIKKKLSTRTLYHATPSINVKNILKCNLDYRQCHINRQKFGPGVCFTPHHGYATYCTEKKKCEMSYLYYEVLIGRKVNRIFEDELGISIDTGIGRNGAVYVKARDDEFNPILLFEKAL